MEYGADGLVSRVLYGDAGHTTSVLTYDALKRTVAATTSRSALPPGTVATDAEPTRQLVLENSATTAFDLRDNPLRIEDRRDGAAWPKGAKPVTRALA